jgi:hypothetical protein
MSHDLVYIMLFPPVYQWVPCHVLTKREPRSGLTTYPMKRVAPRQPRANPHTGGWAQPASSAIHASTPGGRSSRGVLVSTSLGNGAAASAPSHSSWQNKKSV